MKRVRKVNVICMYAVYECVKNSGVQWCAERPLRNAPLSLGIQNVQRSVFVLKNRTRRRQRSPPVLRIRVIRGAWVARAQDAKEVELVGWLLRKLCYGITGGPQELACPTVDSANTSFLETQNCRRSLRSSDSTEKQDRYCFRSTWKFFNRQHPSSRSVIINRWNVCWFIVHIGDIYKLQCLLCS